MNRERLLFAAVLGIVALWFFAMRDPAAPQEGVKTGVRKETPRSVPAADRTEMLLVGSEPGVFTLVTNESPHARPPLPLVAARGLPNIWPPTAYSVSLSRLSRLRRNAAAPVAGGATVELPQLELAIETKETGPAVDRRDAWKSFGRDTKGGKVTGIRVGGKWIREPNELPPPGKPERDSFLRLLMLLEVDPGAAQEQGVSEVEAILEVTEGKLGGGKVAYKFPSDVDGFEIATRGEQKGWFQGLRAYLKLPDRGYDARLRAGGDLLEAGVNDGDRTLVQWARVVLQEAREQVPTAAKDILRQILIKELEAANQLNDQEGLLGLAFHHLSRFPQEDQVLEFVGNVLASRSFRLPSMAETWFARASSSYAQLRRVEVLISMGRFEEAHRIVEAGRTGTGARPDLLRARIALALGDLESARRRAQGYTTGLDAAEAHQILGGVAYAEGDAAKAAEHFLDAARSDPRRSTAYSDLGLAFAVQGKEADALRCFERATALDFENTVLPKIGEAVLKLAGDDLPGALSILDKLRGDNPSDLLVRYYWSYAKERSGDLATAAKSYRSVLDEDHRYRVAIARLGLVQSRRAEGGSDDELVREAVAHLQKAVALDPTDPLLPYILGRFLMARDEQRGVARQLLERAQGLKAPPGDPDLPLWASAAQAALLYRDDAEEELKVKSAFNRVMSDVKDVVRRTGELRELEKHPVYQYCRVCLDVVQENENKVDVTWTFRTPPRDWKAHQKAPMRVRFDKKEGAEFQGTVDFQGQERDFNNILEFCALEYEDKAVTGNSFYEVICEGEIPRGTLVDFGVGLVNKVGGRRRSASGLQVRRKQNTGMIEVRLDGGQQDLFKEMKGKDFIEMTKVPWPEGRFRLRLVVTDREEGECTVFLLAADRPEVNVFEAQMGVPADKCRIFGRGGGSRPVSVIAWVEGNDGDQYEKIYLNQVTLTKGK